MQDSDLSIFFNNDKLGILALINSKSTTGIYNFITVLVNEVETCRPTFTCAEADIPAITHGNLVRFRLQAYQVIGIKRDSTGIITLIL